MQNDDKRKLTSRLNALKSTGPKTPEGKSRAAANSRTHGAYAQSLILPGEEPADFQILLDTHLDTWKPTNAIEDIFVMEMATTLWSLRRQAPAESSLIRIQIQRMRPALEVEFETVSAGGLYALAVTALHSHGNGLSQIIRQGRRLLRQYESLTQQLLSMRQLFPPATPEPDGYHPPAFQESESVHEPELQNEPVETKLTDAPTPYPALAKEDRVHNPCSILYAALPPVVLPARPAKLTQEKEKEAEEEEAQPNVNIQKAMAGAN